MRGPTYLADSVKINSGPAICKLVAVDFLQAPVGVSFANVSQSALSPVSKIAEAYSGSDETLPYVFVVNFCFQFNSENVGCMALYYIRQHDGPDDAACALYDYLLSPEFDDTEEGHRRRAACLKVSIFSPPHKYRIVS